MGQYRVSLFRLLSLNSSVLIFLLNLKGSRLIAKAPAKSVIKACASALEGGGVEKWGCAHGLVFLTFLTAKAGHAGVWGTSESRKSGNTF